MKKKKNAAKDLKGRVRSCLLINTSLTRVKRDGKIWHRRGLNAKRLNDMVPQFWIIHSIKTYKISVEILKFIQRTRETMRVDLTSGGKILAEVKIETEVFQGDDTAQLHTQNMYWWIQSHQITKKDQSPNVHGRHQTVCHRYKKKIFLRIGNRHTQAVGIYSQDLGMEFGKEKYSMLIIRSGKLQITEEIELSNQDKIRTFGEKETYNYLGTLEADNIKQVEMKEKLKKSISGEQESYSKTNYIA